MHKSLFNIVIYSWYGTHMAAMTCSQFVRHFWVPKETRCRTTNSMILTKGKNVEIGQFESLNCNRSKLVDQCRISLEGNTRLYVQELEGLFVKVDSLVTTWKPQCRCHPRNYPSSL